MITIRSQQMDAFEELAWERFAEELAAHLETFEPALCQAAGPEGVRAAAELAIQTWTKRPQ